MIKKETEGYKRIKKTALNYVNSMKIGNTIGLYKKEKAETMPSLYGSYHALHILDMFGELDNFSEKEKDQWASYFLEKQTNFGYFSNNLKDINNERTLREMDSIWHNTRGIIWALRILNRKASKPFKFLEPFMNNKTLYNWVKSYDWSNSWAAANQILACATAMFAQRDWFCDSSVNEVLEKGMYPALEELMDENTGYWGTQFNPDLYYGQFGTIHITPIYFAQGWELKAVEKNVDSTLATQLSDGSFWPGGSDCPDFDGAYMMMNLFELTDYRKEDLLEAAKKYLTHALMHESYDNKGFLLHRRDSKPIQWKPRPHFKWEEGKDTVTEEIRDDNPKRTHIMLGSWFYPLSIALVSHILGDCGYNGPYKLNPSSLHECNIVEI